MSFWKSGFWADDFWINDFWEGLGESTPTDIGVSITNANATTDAPNHINVCDLTGFRINRNEQYYKTWDHLIVRKKSYDPKHPQLDAYPVQDRARFKRRSPEPDTEFLASSIAPEDL